MCLHPDLCYACNSRIINFFNKETNKKTLHELTCTYITSWDWRTVSTRQTFEANERLKASSLLIILFDAVSWKTRTAAKFVGSVKVNFHKQQGKGRCTRKSWTLIFYVHPRTRLRVDSFCFAWKVLDVLPLHVGVHNYFHSLFYLVTFEWPLFNPRTF